LETFHLRVGSPWKTAAFEQPLRQARPVAHTTECIVEEGTPPACGTRLAPSPGEPEAEPTFFLTGQRNTEALEAASLAFNGAPDFNTFNKHKMEDVENYIQHRSYSL
jgi:hypothetical protein